MTPRAQPRLLPSPFAASLVVLALLTAVGVMACGGANAQSEAKRPLPSYSGTNAQLFDDAIEQRAVGLDLEKTEHIDPALRDRTQASDAVLRARVDTVTERDDGASVKFDLGLRTVAKITGDHPPATEFTLHVDEQSPAIGIVRALQTRLSGKTFIVFVREFVRPDGDSDLHFHIAADDKEIARAVEDANVLQDMK